MKKDRNSQYKWLVIRKVACICWYTHVTSDDLIWWCIHADDKSSYIWSNTPANKSISFHVIDTWKEYNFIPCQVIYNWKEYNFISCHVIFTWKDYHFISCHCITTWKHYLISFHTPEKIYHHTNGFTTEKDSWRVDNWHLLRPRASKLQCASKDCQRSTDKDSSEDLT